LSIHNKMPILSIKNLSVKAKDSNRKILYNVSFKIERNSTHLLIGPNGSGKSTLAQTIMGLPRFRVTEGKIIFQGKDITHFPASKRAKMGLTLAFQEPAYFEGIKIRDFLKAGNKNPSEKDLKKSLRLVGLEPDEVLSRYIDKTLSGGERKRIELASVILMKPKVLILDEPDSGLDIIIYKELYDILENVKEETGASILLISHREETGLISQKASFLNKGKIVLTGNFRDVMRKYCQSIGRKKLCRKFQSNL